MTIIVTGGAGFIGSNFIFHMLPDCLLRLLNLCRKFINFRACYGQPEFPFCKGKHYGP